MKYLLLLSVLICQLSVFAQKEKKKEPNVKQYWFVLLKTGPTQNTDSTERANLFAGHFSNMEKLHKEGVLKVAGPFGKNDLTYRGLFILDCKTLDKAKEYVNTDPCVKAGVFIAEITQWYTEPSGSFKPGIPKKKKMNK